MFLVFAWNTYYPLGGSSEIVFKSDAKIDAIKMVDSVSGRYYEYDYYQVIDGSTGETIHKRNFRDW